jgi:hypothetical protein
MVFGWLALVSVRQGWILWRSSSSERGLGALLLGSAAAFATSNFFAVVAFQGLVAVYFWMMIGLVAGARTAQETAGTESRTLGRDYSLSRVIPANEQSRA